MRRLSITIATMLCLASPALAQNCDPAELSGTWRMFLYGDNFETVDSPFILGCTAILGVQGTFRSGSTCVGNELRADLDVRTNCTIRGVITQRFEDGTTLSCGVSAAVNLGRDFISGVGACENSDIFLFNMILR
jgi:hypothetical protein